EQAIASFVGAYLRKDGFLVRMTASGREALAIVGLDAPSLVILDLMLPDLDGLEVCRRIRETSTLPILMLTACGDDLAQIAGATRSQAIRARSTSTFASCGGSSVTRRRS